MADEEKKAKGGKPDKAAGGGKPAVARAEGRQGRARARRAAARRRAAKGDKHAAPASPRPADYKPRMKAHYEKVVRDALKKEFGYGNVMQIPRLEKIVINMGVGEAVNDRKKVDSAAKELSLIAGQRAVVTRARKSIAIYKLRDGMAIGCKVTLRGDRMYEFIDRLVTIALPRVKDFRGLSPEELRRARQLRDGPQGAHRVPRDQLRRRRRGAGHGRDRLHHRRNPTTRPARCCAGSTSRFAPERERAAPGGLHG